MSDFWVAKTTRVPPMMREEKAVLIVVYPILAVLAAFLINFLCYAVGFVNIRR